MNDKIYYFAKKYANWDKVDTICLTFDIDFAPDYMIQNILDILKKYQVRATFFATHYSPLLKKIAYDKQFELGTHIYVDPNSTQGTNLVAIVAEFRKVYPDIFGNRFHILDYSYRDLIDLGKLAYLYDVSTLRFNTPYLLPAFHKDLHLVLLTYFWEDGICENSNFPMNVNSIDLTSPGMKIINFHPMNIFINGSNALPRLKFIRENPNLTNCPIEVASRYRQKGKGAEKLFIELLEKVHKKGYNCLTLKELVLNFQKATSII